MPTSELLVLAAVIILHVMLQARTFNETPIIAKKCCLILTKIMYLINQVNTAYVSSTVVLHS